MRSLLSAAALLATCAFAPAVSAASVVDGSFESAPVPNGGLLFYGAGSTIGGANGWTVFGDGVNAVLGINTNYTEAGVAFPAFDGKVHLDLTGGGNTGANGVYQDIATAIGQTYRLAFYLGNATGNGTGNSGVYVLPSTIGLSIGGGQAQSFENAGVTLGAINWTQYSKDFKATSTSTRVSFINQTPTGDNFAGLDLVSISAIPEASTWAMMILGVGLAGAALRRRRTVPAGAALA